MQGEGRGNNSSEEAVLGLQERPEQPAMLRSLNELHTAVYAERTVVLERDLAGTSWGFLKLQFQLNAELPESERRSFERSARESAMNSAVSKQEFARRGGTSRKTDALQELIVTIVREKPGITEAELLEKLKSMSHGAIIDDIDEASEPEGENEPRIYFHRDGRSKSAPISGLKDRLSRARKVVSKGVAPTR